MRHLRHLLWPFALMYGAGTALRNMLFDMGLLRSRAFAIPVISVGNLEAGGTGKSPLVLHICGLLLNRGIRVAVLSRGYGRQSTGFVLVKTTSTAEEVGDEPLQGKWRFPELMVAACESRVVGIESMLALHPAPDVIVLDDAFQHRWVKPSLNIITTPASLPFWKNHLLPVGTLREGSSGAKRADVLVMTGSVLLETDTGFQGKVFHTRVVGGPPVHFSGKEVMLGEGDTVMLLAGIANPERFVASALERFNLVESDLHPDHHVFSSDDMQRLHDRFHSFGTAIKTVLTTEKDAARLRHSPYLALLHAIPVYYLPIALEWKDGDATDFDQLILDHARTDKRDR